MQPDAEGANLLEEGSVSTGAAVAVVGELVTSPGGKQKVRLPDACGLAMAMRAALSHANSPCCQPGNRLPPACLQEATLHGTAAGRGVGPCDSLDSSSAREWEVLHPASIAFSRQLML